MAGLIQQSPMNKMLVTLITIRDQWGDAFPLDPSQWSDTDGDGFGDNKLEEYQMHSQSGQPNGLIPMVTAMGIIRNWALGNLMNVI